MLQFMQIGNQWQSLQTQYFNLSKSAILKVWLQVIGKLCIHQILTCINNYWKINKVEETPGTEHHGTKSANN